MNFAGDFGGDSLGPFSLGKSGRKNPPKTPQQNSNRNLGVSRRKSTLQGSGLEGFLINNLVDVSDILNFFLLLWGGTGESEAPGGGGLHA